jgi:glycosyltransferase involved in cell wall biosynthesis
MLVLHLITGLQSGGAEGQLKQLVLNSDKHRFTHIVISIQKDGEIGRELEAAGIRVYSLGVKGGIPSPLALVRLIRLMRGFDPDILHCWLYHGCLLGAVIARLAGVRNVIWGLRSANSGFRGYSLQTKMVVQLCARFSSRPSLIVFNSEAGRAMHTAWGYKTSNMRVIPNGIDPSHFYPDNRARKAVRDELGLHDDAIMVGLFARYSPMKDHATFVRAAGLVHTLYPNVRFVLAGKDIGRDNRQLWGLIREYDLEDVTCLLGQRRDMARLTAALDIACLSSRSESFANVIMEAMACSVPCVVTNVGDLASIVGNTGRVVPPSDPSALATAMMAVIAMPPEVRAALGQQGRKRVLEQFTPEKAVRAYENLYTQAAAAPSVEPPQPDVWMEGPGVSRRPSSGGNPHSTVVVHLITGLQCGGAEGQLQQLILRSDKRQFRHVVVSIKADGPIAAELEAAGVEVYSLGFKNRFPSPMGLVRLVRLMRHSRPDVLNCRLYHGCLTGVLARRLAGFPRTIWSLHSANPELRGYNPLTRGIVRLCARLSSHADAIVAVSQRCWTVHRELGYETGRMRIIANGVDAQRFFPDPSARLSVREEFGLPEDSILIGLFARYSPVKDHATFLRAAGLVHCRYSDVRFVLAGTDVEPHNRRLLQLIRENGLQDVTCLLGQRRDMPRLNAALDIACLSSWSESFGNVVVEAMACGVPCVVTDVGELASMLGNAGTVVPPSNPSALAEALMDLIAMPPADRTALGRQGRERVLKQFSVQKMVAAYESLYLEPRHEPAVQQLHTKVQT